MGFDGANEALIYQPHELQRRGFVTNSNKLTPFGNWVLELAQQTDRFTFRRNAEQFQKDVETQAPKIDKLIEYAGGRPDLIGKYHLGTGVGSYTDLPEALVSESGIDHRQIRELANYAGSLSNFLKSVPLTETERNKVISNYLAARLTLDSRIREETRNMPDNVKQELRPGGNNEFDLGFSKAFHLAAQTLEELRFSDLPKAVARLNPSNEAIQASARLLGLAGAVDRWTEDLLFSVFSKSDRFQSEVARRVDREGRTDEQILRDLTHSQHYAPDELHLFDINTDNMRFMGLPNTRFLFSHVSTKAYYPKTPITLMLTPFKDVPSVPHTK